MSIDINNANFKIFTDFAATAKQSARAQLDSKIELNGEMRTVKPAGGLDFIGNVGRLSKHKEAHDTVRKAPYPAPGGKSQGRRLFRCDGRARPRLLGCPQGGQHSRSPDEGRPEDGRRQGLQGGHRGLASAFDAATSVCQFMRLQPFTPPCAANKPKGKKNHHA